MREKLPPAGLERAEYEIRKMAQWARQVGFNNVAPRLEYAQRLIKEEINKREKTATPSPNPQNRRQKDEEDQSR